jgi:Domain of unknown function (DUF397)
MEGSSAVTWRTSSYSGGNGGQCVEVATPGRVIVRDTKDRAGTVLAFGPNAWREFAARVKNDRAV